MTSHWSVKRRTNNIMVKSFEDTKGVIKNRKTKKVKRKMKKEQKMNIQYITQ